MLADLMSNQLLFAISPHLVAISVIIFSALAMFVAVRTVKKIWLAASVPLALVVVATLIITLHNITGQPTERSARGTFKYLGYVLDSKDSDWMYLWIIEDPENNGAPITLRVPYSEELHDNADEASEFESMGLGMNGEEEGGMFEFHLFRPMDRESDAQKEASQAEQDRLNNEAMQEAGRIRALERALQENAADDSLEGGP